MQPWHWIVVIVVLVILFGSKKLPDAARGLGRSMRIFKSEIGEMQSDGSDKATPDKKADRKRELPAPEAPVADPVRNAAEDRADT